MADTQRYWDGRARTANVAPLSPAGEPTQAHRQSQAVVAFVLAASAIGLVMSLQSASLLTGTGTLWTGVAIACGAGAAAYVLRKSIPRWIRVVAIIAALIALANVLHVENEMQDRRREISQLFP